MYTHQHRSAQLWGGVGRIGGGNWGFMIISDFTTTTTPATTTSWWHPAIQHVYLTLGWAYYNFFSAIFICEWHGSPVGRHSPKYKYFEMTQTNLWCCGMPQFILHFVVHWTCFTIPAHCTLYNTTLSTFNWWASLSKSVFMHRWMQLCV